MTRAATSPRTVSARPSPTTPTTRSATVSGATANLSYDPLGRLYQVAGTSTAKFLYAGDRAIGEYNGSDALQRRFVPGAGVDETVVWYEGSVLTNRNFLMADERGSVVAVTNSSGAVTTINKYDDYGAPASGNQGRFQWFASITEERRWPRVVRKTKKGAAFAAPLFPLSQENSVFTPIQ